MEVIKEFELTNEKIREAGSKVFGAVGWTLMFSLKALLALIVGVIAWAFYVSWDVDRWDAKIEALCAANGGRDVATKVYETVMAPETKEYFRRLNPPGSFHIPERSKGQSFGAAYPYVMETRVEEVLHHENPSVVRFTSKVIRVEDGKVLAERGGYQRAGGGVPGIDPGEIRVCPKMTEMDRLELRVFRNHPEYSKWESK